MLSFTNAILIQSSDKKIYPQVPYTGEVVYTQQT